MMPINICNKVVLPEPVFPNITTLSDFLIFKLDYLKYIFEPLNI